MLRPDDMAKTYIMIYLLISVDAKQFPYRYKQIKASDRLLEIPTTGA